MSLNIGDDRVNEGMEAGNLIVCAEYVLRTDKEFVLEAGSCQK